MAGCCCHTNTASLHEWTFQPYFPAEPSVTSDWTIFPRYCPMISSSVAPSWTSAMFEFLNRLPMKLIATLNSNLSLHVSVRNKSAKWSEIVNRNVQIGSARSPNRWFLPRRSSESNHRHWAPQCCSACGGVGQLQVQGVQRSPACQTGVETGQQPATAR